MTARTREQRKQITEARRAADAVVFQAGYFICSLCKRVTPALYDPDGVLFCGFCFPEELCSRRQ